MREGRYDFVFMHLPTPDTHGHHQAASILALEAVAELEPTRRPVPLGAFPTGRNEERPKAPEMLAAKIRNGGQGVWGAIPMPGNAQLSAEDLQSVVKWILEAGR